MKKISWGILSTAKIGTEKVIPAMQRADYCDIRAIASRNLEKAKETAQQLNIPKAHGSYEALLADEDIQAIYNPMPNHLHVEWSIKALEAGKHVLTEKPLGMTAKESGKLLQAAAKFPHLKIMEAFMYRHHPHWVKAKELVRDGKIGTLRAVQTFFSYNNTDAQNIRNRADAGGGALLDIGCYCVSFPRFMFDREPERVAGALEYDPNFKTDRLTSGLLDFGMAGTSTFTCSTQLQPYQRANIFGTRGRIEIEIPVTAPPDRPTRLWFQSGDDIEEITFPICDQYGIQGDLFSQAILNDTPVPTPLSDGLANMRVLDAILQSSESGKFVSLS